MKRLDLLVELIKGFNVVVDIGCDHAYVLQKALIKNYIKEAIAVDIAKGPLLAAEKNLKGLDAKLILSNGFEKVEQTYDAAVIAGLGCETITNILSTIKKPNDATYIISSNNKIYELRCWLIGNGFEIIDEKIVYEGLYYPIIIAKKGKQSLSEVELVLGPYLINNVDSLPYFRHQLNYYNDLLNKVPTTKKDEISQIINYLHEVINRLESYVKNV